MRNPLNVIGDFCRGINALVMLTFVAMTWCILADMIGINPIYAMGKELKKSLDYLVGAPNRDDALAPVSLPPIPIEHDFFTPNQVAIPNRKPNGEDPVPNESEPILTDFGSEEMI